MKFWFSLWLISAAALLPDGSVPGTFRRLGPFGGDVRSLLLDSRNPDRVYLGTADGQIFKSVDGGAGWTQLFPGLGRRQLVVDTLVQHPDEQDRIYAGGWDLRSNGGALFETRDGGVTWQAVALPSESPGVRDFAICRARPEYMIAGTRQRVYLSADSGRSWRESGPGFAGLPEIESVAIDPHRPAIVFVGTRRLAFRSTDSGRSWKRLERGMLLDSHVFSIYVEGRVPGLVYAGACSGIYRSENGAETWTRLKVAPPNFTVRAHVVAADPLNERRVYGGTTAGLFVSNDRGTTWRRLTAADINVNAIQVDPRGNGTILLGTADAGVLRSRDGGRTWRESNDGFVFRKISRILPAGREGSPLLAGVLGDGARGGLFQLGPEQTRWAALTPEIAPKAEVLSVVPLPSGDGRLAGTSQGIWRQPSPGRPWMRLSGRSSRLAVHDLAVDPRAGWVLAATSAGLYRSRLKPMSFVPAGNVRARIFALTLAPGSPGTVFAASEAGVLRSRNHGAHWDCLTAGLPRVPVEAVAVSPGGGGHLFAGTMAGLFESRDGGESWSKARDGRLGVDVPAVVFLDGAGRRVMAADNTFGGVFVSHDAGAAWQKIFAPEFGSPVRFIAPDPADSSRVFLGTATEGVYDLTLSD